MTPMRSPACSSPALLTQSEIPTGNAIPISSAAGKIAAMLVTASGPTYASAVPAKTGPAQAKSAPGVSDEPHRHHGCQRQQQFERRQHADEAPPAAAREWRRQPTADRDSGQHRCQHDRERVGRRTEQQDQHPEPDDLEPERDEA